MSRRIPKCWIGCRFAFRSDAQQTIVELPTQTLNSSYEHLYPGLRYITFVNGRSKAEIADEMEAKLKGDATPLKETSPAYEEEVKRAVQAIFDIAHSRLQRLSSPKDGIR